jgi:uncharacterized membrane protein
MFYAPSPSQNVKRRVRVLGGFLALCSAATFAINNTFARRGVIAGTVLQALSISVPIGLPIFLIAALATGSFALVAAFSPASLLWLSLAGIVHFVWGRYCNYRAVKAIGSNLAGPVQESSVLVALGLAVWLLGEALTPLKVLGIVLVLLGPAVAVELGRKKPRIAEQTRHTRAATALFSPAYAEGYLFAALSATGYGTSPILVRMGLAHGDILASIAGGLVSYAAATLVVLAVLAVTGSFRHVLSMSPSDAKWFGLAGLFVGISQMLRYMALAIAPVSVVAPIQRMSLLFRYFFSWVMNREHEVFGSRILLGTLLSLVGVVFLSVSTEEIVKVLPLPAWLAEAVAWRWS